MARRPTPPRHHHRAPSPPGRFVEEYNHRRPHRSLNRATPAAAYQRLPKAGPTGSDAGTHHRVRNDHIDTNGSMSLRRAGRMHHIGLRRALAGTPVVVLVADLDIRVIHAHTGEITLTLDPTRDYQPRFKT